MSSEGSFEEGKRTPGIQLPWRIVEFVVLPIVVGLFLLFVEYRSGVFQEASVLDAPRGMGRPLTILWAFALFVFTFMGLRTFFLWLRHHHHFREEFAAFGVLTILFLIPTVLGSLLTGIMPWSLVFQLITGLRDGVYSPPRSSFESYLLLGLLAITFAAAIRAGYNRWDGKKSVAQYQAEQRRETIGLTPAGLRELRRMLGRSAPHQAYKRTRAIDYVSQLEPVTDTLVWSELAKELLRLSSSIYAFDSAKDWHDRPGCWLGSNVMTGDVVCLFPAQYDASADEIGKVIVYADKIAANQGRRVDEIVVAVRSEVATPVKEWNGRQIHFKTELTLLDSLVSFRDYENEIRRRVRSSLLPDSQFAIDDVYVPSQFFVQDEQHLQDNVEQYLREWIDEPGRRQLALLGEYGQGKSTAALMLTYHLLCEEKEYKRIPLLIELRGRSPRNQTPLGLLGDWASQYRMDPQALMRLLVAGRLVLIFEGFDEMALIGDAEMRLQHFSTLWKFSFPESKILITGRPNFFLDEKEMKAALGIGLPIADRAYCEAIRLAPFNIDQIDQSLRNYDATTRNQICALASENARFRELVARPSLLHMVASLWRKEGLSEIAEQLNSAYVMDLFIRRSYSRQGLKQEAAPGFMALTTSERGYFMRGIAAYMAAHGLQNHISGTELNSVIAVLMKVIPDSVTLQEPMISGESRQPLRSRLHGSEYGVDHVQTDVRACGLLVDDPASPGTFRFGHKSFMEYLYAAVVAEYISEDAPVMTKAILNATRASAQDILSLPNSVGFLSEIVTADVTNHPIRAGQLPESDREYRFVRRSFKSLASNSGASFVIARIRLFDGAYGASLQCLSRTQQIILGLFRPVLLILLVLALSPAIVLNVVGRRTYLATLGILDSPWLIVLTISGIILLAVVLALLFFHNAKEETDNDLHDTRRILDDLSLWNYLCLEISINHQAMHRLAGTWFLPWARKQPFDYFLPRLKDEQD